MQVAELRQRLLQRIAGTVSSGDGQTIADVTRHARTLLVAVAECAPDEAVDIRALWVDTDTAALILGVPHSLIMALINAAKLTAVSEEGRSKVRLSEIADLNTVLLPEASAEEARQSVLPSPAKWVIVQSQRKP